MTGINLAVHPMTGEVMDLAAADTIVLASTVVELAGLRDNLTDFERAVSGELIDRLDRDAKWTLRVGDPTGDRQLEIKAPSPTAGTSDLDPVVLERELTALIDAGTVTDTAAAAALERALTIRVRVPFGADLADLARVAGDVDAINAVPVVALKVTADRRVSTAGVNALRKVPGTQAALDAATVPRPAPTRRVKVRAVHRERGAA